MRNRAEEVQRGRELARIGLERRLGLLQRAGVAPDDAAHLLEVQMLREGRAGRDDQEGEEAVDVVGRLLMNSRYQRITSAACSISQSIGPA